MREKIQKIKNNVIRWATNEDVSHKMYLGWTVLVVLLMGVFGIYPATRELIGKYQLSRQMVVLNQDLLKKSNEVSIASEKIKAAGTDVAYLDRYLPESFDLQNYMIDFITASGRAGYSVDTFVPTDQQGSEINIYVSLSGGGDLIQLIQNLENMNRISEIQSIGLSKMGAGSILRLIIKTYIMEKQ